MLKNNSKGMTLLEVLLAIVIFSIVSVSIMSLIGNVDKMRVRNKKRDIATLMASNTAELLKYYGAQKHLNDSIYTVNIKGIDYRVERIKIGNSNIDKNVHAIEIRVFRKDELIKSFRLLQGALHREDE